MDGHVALTHTSALVALGIDVWGADLSKVHVTRLDDATGRVCAGVHHHDAVATEPDLVRTPSGLLVSSPARAVLEHASLSTIVSGLVSADHGLHLGLFTDEELADRHRAMEHWPSMRHVQVVIRLADGGSESPGETRTRHLCWRAGLPAPVLQYEVYDARGRFVGRTDFAWPRYRLLGEFDGRGKYLRHLRPGQEVADVVLAEKRREDRLREVTRWGMVRVTWSELATVSETAERIRRQLMHAA
jgi:hypothetical protein